jgi:hypothetical protein
MNVLKYRKGKNKKLKRIQTKVFKTWVIKMAFFAFLPESSSMYVFLSHRYGKVLKVRYMGLLEPHGC